MAQLSKADQTYLTKEQQQEILALKTAWEQANAAGDEQAKKAANQRPRPFAPPPATRAAPAATAIPRSTPAWAARRPTR